MTIYAWDESHYGAPPTARDGIDVYTHKLTDGDHYYEDAEYQAAMNAARSLGMVVLGPYHVLHGQRSIANQARWLVERADRLTPWWRDWPDWIWQIDAEPFDYLIKPTIGEVNAFGDELVCLSGRPALAVNGYCPAWAYSDSELRQLRFPWWPSNYGSNPAVPYRQAYPGDSSSRWAGPIPARFLQYGSKTIIAGQSTCDANAYRGTLAQLQAEIRSNGDDDMARDKWLLKLDDGQGRHNWRLCDGYEYRPVMMDTAIEQALAALYGQPIVVTSAKQFDAMSGPEYVPTSAPVTCECTCTDSGNDGGSTRPPDFILSGTLALDDGTFQGRAVPGSETGGEDGK